MSFGCLVIKRQLMISYSESSLLKNKLTGNSSNLPFFNKAIKSIPYPHKAK